MAMNNRVEEFLKKFNLENQQVSERPDGVFIIEFDNCNDWNKLVTDVEDDDEYVFNENDTEYTPDSAKFVYNNEDWDEIVLSTNYLSDKFLCIFKLNNLK